jgi:hypothetical protein
MLFDIQRFYNVVIEELPANVADLLWSSYEKQTKQKKW